MILKLLPLLPGANELIGTLLYVCAITASTDALACNGTKSLAATVLLIKFFIPAS